MEAPGQNVPVTLLTLGNFSMKDIPEEEQVAIRQAVGTRVNFVQISYGLAEIEFPGADGMFHTIWVTPDCLGPLR